MDRQTQGPQDDDDFLESLRRAADREPAPSEAEPSPRADDRPAQAVDGTAGLPDLEARLAELEHQIRRLNEHYDRLVSDVADAVVARLDARWARSLTEDSERID